MGPSKRKMLSCWFRSNPRQISTCIYIGRGNLILEVGMIYGRQSVRHLFLQYPGGWLLYRTVKYDYVYSGLQTIQSLIHLGAKCLTKESLWFPNLQFFPSLQSKSDRAPLEAERSNRLHCMNTTISSSLLKTCHELHYYPRKSRKVFLNHINFRWITTASMHD